MRGSPTSMLFPLLCSLVVLALAFICSGVLNLILVAGHMSTSEKLILILTCSMSWVIRSSILYQGSPYILGCYVFCCPLCVCAVGEFDTIPWYALYAIFKQLSYIICLLVKCLWLKSCLAAKIGQKIRAAK